MKKVSLFFVPFIIKAVFIGLSFASSGDVQFGIKEITVLNDKNILILFNKPLAKEPVEFKIYNSSGETLSIVNVDFPKFDAENNEALITVGGRLEKSSVYKVLVTSALSFYGERLNQSDIKDATTFETQDQIPSYSSGQTSGGIDLNALFRESLNSSNSNSVGENVSNNASNLVGTDGVKKSPETEKSLRNTSGSSGAKQSKPSTSGGSSSMSLQTDKNQTKTLRETGSTKSDAASFGGLETEKLPKAGPEIDYLLLLVLLLVLFYFILLTSKKNEIKK